VSGQINTNRCVVCTGSYYVLLAVTGAAHEVGVRKKAYFM
jgi:hypothetical protein